MKTRILRTLQALFMLWVFAYTFENIQTHEFNSARLTCQIENALKAHRERIACPKAKKRDPKDIIHIRDLLPKFEQKESAKEVYEHDASSPNLIT